MHLWVLIACDIWLAWSLTKFKGTITKQKGSRKDATTKMPLCSAFTSPGFPSGLPHAHSAMFTKTHSLCSEYGALRHQTSPASLGQASLPLWSYSRPSPFTFIASCLDVNLGDHPTEPSLSTLLPLLDPSHRAVQWKQLKTEQTHLENVRKVSLRKSERRCGGVNSIQLVSIAVYFSMLGEYKIKEYAYLYLTKSIESPINSLSLRIYFWDTISFTYTWQVHSFLLRSMGFLSM